ncbi:MAG: 16S rRNA (guanine(966)-N(2))-methyltransferase RsmD [Dehalococcoidia bacterium]
MRVIGGTARGRQLKRPGANVRPTSDLVRGAIFDVLAAHEIDDASVLDLYAGSGALGIEALSRGAGRCDFVEHDAKNMMLIRENLMLTGLQERARTHTMTAAQAAARLTGPYSLVLADPPYDDEAALGEMALAATSRLVGKDTTVVLEHSSRREPPALGKLRLAWTRRYGDTQVSIYHPKDATMSAPPGPGK